MANAVIQSMGACPPVSVGTDASVVSAAESAPSGSSAGVEVSGYTRLGVVLRPSVGSPACTLRPWVMLAGVWQRVRSNVDGSLVEYTTLAGEGFVMTFDVACCDRFALQVQAITAATEVERSYRITGPGA